MDDLASKLGELLNNPESMEKIKNLAGMFGATSAPAVPDPPEEVRAPTVPPVDGESIQMIMKIAPLLSRVRQEDDSTRLLRALRPFLKEDKQTKLDEAIKLMQIVRMVPLIKNIGLF
jgi:hypothetical protein